MRIGFLTLANSWHIPVKTKYLTSNNHDVYYFQIQPGTNQPITPDKVVCIDIKSTLIWPFNHIHKCLILYRQTKSLDLDILHIVDMKYSYFSFFAKTKKIVIENNGSDVLVLPKKYKFIKYIYKLIYKKADAVVQDSKQAQLAGIKYGAPKINNEIIELGIDFNIFNESVSTCYARQKLKLKNEKIVFSPRGFSDLYNIDTIIKSIPLVKKKYPDIKYVFCWHYGKNENYYNDLITSLGVATNVIFTGYLDNEKDLPFYYKDADIVVSVPSSDSSPRSVYEAMACLKPVIISELPWYHNKFKKNENVFVVPIKDEISLAEVIVKYFNREIDINLNSAYQYVKSEINMIDSSMKLEKLYLRLLNKNKD